jgi:hypothetical protein
VPAAPRRRRAVSSPIYPHALSASSNTPARPSSSRRYAELCIARSRCAARAYGVSKCRGVPEAERIGKGAHAVGARPAGGEAIAGAGAAPAWSASSTASPTRNAALTDCC